MADFVKSRMRRQIADELLKEIESSPSPAAVSVEFISRDSPADRCHVLEYRIDIERVTTIRGLRRFEPDDLPPVKAMRPEPPKTVGQRIVSWYERFTKCLEYDGPRG